MRIAVFTTVVAATALVGPPAPAAAQPAGEAVTFTEHVAPVFYESCTTCHRPGQVAPMSLLTYEDARPWVRAIRQKVLDREMPPWDADPAVGVWANDRSLSEEAIDTIVAWADGGSPRGHALQPPLPAYADSEWSIGEPDAVFAIQPFEPLALPVGSRIHASAWYDNSAANRSNPDPTAEVRWGEQTDEEMMYTALSFLIDDEAAAETTQQD